MKRRAEKCAIFCPVALQGKKKVICVLTQTSIQKLPLKFARRCHGKYLSNDFLEKEQPHQKKVSWKQSRKKAKAPAVKRFYCSFTIYMKVFCYYRSFGSKQTTMYPPAPPRLFLYLPFHCLLRPPVFSGPKSMDFLFFLSSDFCCCCIIIVYIILYLEIILNNFFCTTNHRERHIYMFSNKGCINCLEIALFLLKVQFISLSRRHGISFQKNRKWCD